MAMANIPDTLANYLVAATAIPISPDLIGPASIESILPIAAQLPGAITSFFGFECPLGSDEPRADFLVSVKTEGRPILAGLSQERRLPADFKIHPVWERVAQFASLWADPQSALHGRVHNMWLEFDIHDSPPAIPVPSVFFGALDGILCANAGSDWLTEAALPALQPGLDSGTLRSVGRCIACLPSGAWIFQVGLMLARPAQVARLCIRGIAPAEVTGFLQAGGWQGPAVEVQALLDRFAPYSQRVDLDIDVATDLRPKIGLECYPEPFPAGRARLIDSMEEQGLCRPLRQPHCAAPPCSLTSAFTGRSGRRSC